MSQLIITVVALLLTALVILGSVNYLPWWYKTAENAEEITRTSLHVLEDAYSVATRASNGVSPSVDAAAEDGGFSSRFLPILHILPAALPQFVWRYGQANGLNYFCMESTGAYVNEGAIRGLLRGKAVFSESQVTLNTTCGSTTSLSPTPLTSTHLALTMFVTFVPGVSR